MAYAPKVQCAVNVTTKDINGNSIAKQYNNVFAITFDYAKGMVTIQDDVQGYFTFSLFALANLIYTSVTTSSPPVHTATIS